MLVTKDFHTREATHKRDIVIRLKFALDDGSLVIEHFKVDLSLVQPTHQGEPRKDEVERLIQHLHVDPKLAYKGMRRPIDVRKLHSTMDSLHSVLWYS